MWAAEMKPIRVGLVADVASPTETARGMTDLRAPDDGPSPSRRLVAITAVFDRMRRQTKDGLENRYGPKGGSNGHQVDDVLWSAATGGAPTHLPGRPSGSSALSQAVWTSSSTLSGLRSGVTGVALRRSATVGAGAGVGFDHLKSLVPGQ